jgi:hypothetical protein
MWVLTRGKGNETHDLIRTAITAMVFQRFYTQEYLVDVHHGTVFSHFLFAEAKQLK